MNDNKIPYLKQLLQAQIPSVVSHLIGPVPQRGGYFTCGDLNGAPGKSTRINAETGVWQDFATGERGDVIQLFRQKYNGDFRKSLEEIERFLGVQSSEAPLLLKPKMEQPIKDWTSITHGDFVYQYLEGRGINEETVDKYSSLICKKGEDTIVYLCGIERKLIYAHYKSVSKSHNPYGTKNSDKCLWGSKHDKDPTEIVITEGMEDALSFAEQGFTGHCMSVPCGAENTKWLLLSSSWAEKAETIYIATDNDEPGNKLAEVIVSAFGTFKCKRIHFGEYKDANEFHLNDTTGEGLLKLLEESEHLRPKEIMNVDDILTYINAKRSSGRNIEMPFAGWQDFRWRVRSSELTVLTGPTSAGKSTLLYNAMTWYTVDQCAKVGLISPEVNADSILYNMASIASAKPYHEIRAGRHNDVLERMKEFNESISVVNSGSDIGKKNIFKWLTYFAKSGCHFVIVDALQEIDIDITDNAKVASFMREMESFTKDSGCHVFLTAHTRKEDGYSITEFPNKNHIHGSYTIASMAFNILGIIRNEEKEEIIKNPDEHTDDERAEASAQPDGGIKVLKDKTDGENVQVKQFYYIEPECKRIIPAGQDRVIESWI